MINFGHLIGIIDDTGYRYQRTRADLPIITDEHGDEITKQQNPKAIYHLKLGSKDLDKPDLFLATKIISKEFLTRQVSLEQLKNLPFIGLAGLLISAENRPNELNLRQFEQTDPVLFKQATIIADQNSSAYRINISYGHEDLLKQPGRFYVSFMYDDLNPLRIGMAINSLANTYMNFEKLIEYLARDGLEQAGLLGKEKPN